jgi:hypothetical protein
VRRVGMELHVARVAVNCCAWMHPRCLDNPHPTAPQQAARTASQVRTEMKGGSPGPKGSGARALAAPSLAAAAAAGVGTTTTSPNPPAHVHGCHGRGRVGGGGYVHGTSSGLSNAVEEQQVYSALWDMPVLQDVCVQVEGAANCTRGVRCVCVRLCELVRGTGGGQRLLETPHAHGCLPSSPLSLAKRLCFTLTNFRSWLPLVPLIL